MNRQVLKSKIHTVLDIESIEGFPGDRDRMRLIFTDGTAGAWFSALIHRDAAGVLVPPAAALTSTS